MWTASIFKLRRNVVEINLLGGGRKKSILYRYFYFANFRLTNDGKIAGWDAKPVEPKDLSHLSYSKRMSYLNN